jgi:hypothetical protein
LKLANNPDPEDVDLEAFYGTPVPAYCHGFDYLWSMNEADNMGDDGSEMASQ